MLKQYEQNLLQKSTLILLATLSDVLFVHSVPKCLLFRGHSTSRVMLGSWYVSYPCENGPMQPVSALSRGSLLIQAASGFRAAFSSAAYCSSICES